mmetsp:Transcript_4087/g.13219  ORF Transcript_4087/g.13219 Transcript_4087/m.13219 type:complete len:333 (-) Transcript_4087:2731-3729(-)
MCCIGQLSRGSGPSRSHSVFAGSLSSRRSTEAALVRCGAHRACRYCTSRMYVCCVSSSSGRCSLSSSSSCHANASGVSSTCVSPSGLRQPATHARTRKPHSGRLGRLPPCTSPLRWHQTVSPSTRTSFHGTPGEGHRPTSSVPSSSVLKRMCAVPLSSERRSSLRSRLEAPSTKSRCLLCMRVPSSGCGDCSVAMPFFSRRRWPSASSRSSSGSALKGPGNKAASRPPRIRPSIMPHSREKAIEPAEPPPTDEWPDEWYASLSRSSSSRGRPSCSRLKAEVASSSDSLRHWMSERRQSTLCRTSRIASIVCAAPETAFSPLEFAPRCSSSGR